MHTFPHCLTKLYQRALHDCINFCFKSRPVIQYSAVYNLLSLNKLCWAFLITALHVSLESFRHSPHHKVTSPFAFIAFFPYVCLQHDLFSSTTSILKPTSVKMAQKFISARCRPALSPSTQSCILDRLQQRPSPSSLLIHFWPIPHYLCHHFHWHRDL